MIFFNCEKDVEMIRTLQDFIEKFNEIKAMGWIKTHRAGPTGIGKTLEDLLGIPENNADEPDFGEYELKSKRIDANSMLTIFTRAPQPPRANTYLLNKYGYASDAYDNDEKVLHSTLAASHFARIGNTGKSLIIKFDDEKIWLASETEDENVYWDRANLKKAFDKKYKNKFVYAYAESRGSGKDEEFRFTEAFEMSGFSYEDMIELLEQGKVYVDLRIGQYHGGKNAGKTHDHGTGFRIKEDDQPKLFKNKKKIA